MKEVLKWAHGLGVGALLALLHYVQGVQGGNWWQVVVAAVLVRAMGWIVAKLPAKA